MFIFLHYYIFHFKDLNAIEASQSSSLSSRGVKVNSKLQKFRFNSQLFQNLEVNQNLFQTF